MLNLGKAYVACCYLSNQMSHIAKAHDALLNLRNADLSVLI